MTTPLPDEQRAAWLDLSQRYAFLYDCTLQEGLVPMREDIAAWWWLGGSLNMPGKKRAGPTLKAVANTAGPSHASVSPASSRRSNPPAAANVADPKQHGETPFTSLPPAVRAVIGAVALEYCVSIGEIMSWQKRGRIADARIEVYRRLRAMPWRGDHPSLLQIGIWLHRDHTTVLHGVHKKSD